MSLPHQHKILVACGGSGGHLLPGLVVREELISRGHQVLLGVSNKEIDQKILAQNDLEADIVFPANRSSGIFFVRPLRLIISLIKGSYKAYRFIRSNEISFVLGMGGFSCVPALLAAKLLKTSSAIHESNVIPGRATRIFAKNVNQLFVAFPQCLEHLKGVSNAKVVGIPTRFDNSSSKIDLDYLRKKFRLENGKKTILVLGGSQGSEFLNKLISDTAPLLAIHRDALQILHITGKTEPINAHHPLKAAGIHRVHFEFHNAMDELYRLADLVIARSGSGVIAEVLEFGLKTILIPLPTAADNHQYHNAKAVESENQIEVLEQKHATPQRLVEMITRLLSAKPPTASRRKPRHTQRPEKLIADAIERLLQGGRP